MFVSHSNTLLSSHDSLLIIFFFFLMIRRPPRSTLSSSSAASDVYKRQVVGPVTEHPWGSDQLVLRWDLLTGVYHNVTTIQAIDMVGGNAAFDQRRQEVSVLLGSNRTGFEVAVVGLESGSQRVFPDPVPSVELDNMVWDAKSGQYLGLGQLANQTRAVARFDHAKGLSFVMGISEYKMSWSGTVAVDSDKGVCYMMLLKADGSPGVHLVAAHMESGAVSAARVCESVAACPVSIVWAV
eukprot:TRINITY_DN17366_c0_g1_i1.p1 TRINITY_DN17366_c0_g1~~TRINITY_DN17366_c0_g1_i1.p1  ORF type:complete len:239 (+),score=58.92 TRINITY_DN17366_c0_g1_i1:3-719(+)